MLSKPFSWTFALTLGLAVLGAKSVNAQRVDAPKRAVVQPETGQGQTYRAKQIIGGKVNIDGNVSIGTVDDIVFDDSGFVEYLIVANEGKLVTVPWEAAKFNFQERTAYVKITNEQYRQIPTYSVEKYPVFSTPDYRIETYKYYGLPPRERRVDRRLDRKS